MCLREKDSKDEYLGFCILSKAEKDHNSSGLTTKIKQDTAQVIDRVKGLEEKMEKVAMSEGKLNQKMDRILELRENKEDEIDSMTDKLS